MTAGRVRQSDSREARHTAPRHAANTNKKTYLNTQRPSPPRCGSSCGGTGSRSAPSTRAFTRRPSSPAGPPRCSAPTTAWAPRCRRSTARGTYLFFVRGDLGSASCSLSYLCNQHSFKTHYAIPNSYLRTCKAISNRATKSSWHPDNVVQALVRAATASNPRSQVTG